MIGLERVVALDTPSHMWSARWLRQYTDPLGVCSTLPAPATSWREIRNGMKRSASRAKSPREGADGSVQVGGIGPD